MTIDTSKSETTPYHSLLDYFSRPRADALEPIAHPDSSINKMVDSRHNALRKAAVLIPITRLDSDNDSHIVLTVRSENLRSHAGQISLPGGTRDAEDSDDIATALRESEEEIGLPASQVEVIGKLGDMALPSGFHITPIVGLIQPGLTFTPALEEVADIFQAPLDLVLDPNAYKASFMTFNDIERKILELHHEDYRIWGATAAILYHLAMQVAKVRRS
ncbi:MAG TPA: CoA pyrophosphatase [Gammaproteobacteria bacterium]|jgi:8-oxo-dGTP pyrophosphatase MutT (NUDIX family)|nr:CoA pyrophosphatase [Gammaproteobacteria bacterium]HAT26594.1 CoA pyrophosphatase [Gammaproteobacteria bacterium]HIA58672.1 CoA pyrophosphatase [Gammaproteobacteria bacterium]HIF86324.1 CoA pyrophosphatase [Gammaproteobacteria bacterium]HIN90901.1 CoA pyrophosphatase [Porticoccaceae bacterium]|tara:strand:- start:30630 stop:31283 length:654 start_codon:yes stop_codon:yes gene_type:complete